MKIGIETHQQLAPLASIFNLAYSTPAPLLHNSEIYQSTSGARQGCVLGSLFFSLGLQTVIDTLSQEFPHIPFKVYLDDFTVAFPARHQSTLSTFIPRLTELLWSRCQLRVRENKCKYLSSVPIPFLSNLRFQHCTDSIEVLGASIGNQQACERFCLASANSHEKFFGLLKDPALPPGVASDILRVCGVPRMTHISRTMPPMSSATAMTQFDNLVQATLASLIHVSSLHPSALQQITFPVARGGLGLVRFAETASLAYRASMDAFGVNPVPEDELRTQAQLTATLYAERLESIMTGHDLPLRSRLLSCTGPASWVLNSSEIRCPETWRLAIKLRLGIPVRGQNTPCVCGQVLSGDCYADHVFSCPKTVGVTPVARHNVLQSTIRNVLHVHGIPTVEITGAYHRDSGKKPDFLVITATQTIAVDLTIVHPLCSTMLANAAQHKGYSASIREAEKSRKHGKAAEEQGHIFSPWVFETLGHLGGELNKSIRLLSEQVQRPEAFVADFLKQTGLTLQTMNARMLQNALIQAESRVPLQQRPKSTLQTVPVQRQAYASRLHSRVVEWQQ